MSEAVTQERLAVTSAMLSVLRHAVGQDQYGKSQGQRNHFVTDAGTGDYAVCQELVASGLMQRYKGNELSGGADIFCATPKGLETLEQHREAPPKLTPGQKRYRQYLAFDCGLSFGEWLKLGGPHFQT